MGPNCCSKDGTTLRLPKRLGTSRNIGFSGGCGVPWPGLGTRKPPEPPKVGWAWHSKHCSALCRAPRPLELVWNWGKIGSSSPSPVTGEPGVTSEQVSQVDSNWPARLIPSLKEASSLAVIVAPVVGLGLMTGGCGIGMPRCCKAPAVLAIPPRTPGSVCARAGTHDRHSSAAVEITKVRKFLMDMLPFSP